MRCSATARMLVVGMMAAAVCSAGAAGAEGPGRWQDLHTPGGRVAVDSGGQLWVCTSESLRYWDGREFQGPRLNELPDGTTLSRVQLTGDPGSGAYALVPGSEPHQASAYRLADGEVRFVTDYYRDIYSNRSGFCVSRSGVLVNYGTRFLATKRAGDWQRVEARIGGSPIVVSTPHHVVFPCDGWIYTVDDEGRIAELSEPELRVVEGRFGSELRAALGEGENVLISNPSTDSSYVFNAETGRLTLWVPPASGRDVTFTAPRFFRTMDGSPRLVKLSEEDLRPAWLTTSTWQSSLRLAASNGDIWSAVSDGVVTRYRDGKLTVYDWHDGLPMSMPSQVLEGAGGQIFVCSYGTIYAFFPDRQPEPLPAGLALWEEYHPAAGSRVVQDSNGLIWMQMWDSPGELSVWNGQEWRRLKVPFELNAARPILADDRGRVLFSKGGYNQPAYVVGLNGAKAYESNHAMLQALVADGVRRFTAAPGQPGCVVTRDGRIWHGRDYFDGSLWTEFSSNSTSDRIYESPAYGVLFCSTEGTRYLYYDRGQFVPLPTVPARIRIWLLGRDGLQPFEEELVKEQPGAFLPALRMPPGRFSLLRRMPDSADADPPVSDVGDALPDLGNAAVPGVPPVFYLAGYGSARRWAVQGRTFPLGLAGTPMATSQSFSGWMMLDPAHNLWIVRSSSAFVKTLADFRIATGPLPQSVGGVLRIDVSLVEAGLDDGQGHVFWRVNEGPYEGGVAPGKVEVPFQEDGEYRVEMIGVDPQGAVTPEPLRFSVRSTVVIPETEATAEGPFTVKDVVWRAPVRAVPPAPEAECTVAYRIDDGEWRMLEDGVVRTGGLEPGRHTAEFAAQQVGGLRDRSPVRVEFDYEPDYEAIVESRMAALGGADPAAARRAMDEIRSAGPDVLPVLERKLEEARRAARTADDLRRAIDELSK